MFYDQRIPFSQIKCTSGSLSYVCPLAIDNKQMISIKNIVVALRTIASYCDLFPSTQMDMNWYVFLIFVNFVKYQINNMLGTDVILTKEWNYLVKFYSALIYKPTRRNLRNHPRNHLFFVLRIKEC